MQNFKKETFPPSLWKSSPEWKSGRALFYALNMEPWATTSGRGMLHFPGALTFITRYILLVDLFTPLLIFVPWKYGRVRTYTIIVAIMLQVLLAMMLRLGLFPFMVMTALLALLPAWYWETQERSAHFSDHLEWELTERFSRREGGLKLPSSLGYVASATSILTLLLVLVWNVAELRGSQPNARLQRVAHLVRLDQKWDLLAPRPYQDDGWYVAPVEMKDGNLVDVFRQGAPVRWNKPPEAEVFRQAQSHHFLIFLSGLRTQTLAAYRPLYAQFLCRDWNETHGNTPANTVEVDFMRRLVLFDHGTYTMARKYPLAKESCR